MPFGHGSGRFDKDAFRILPFRATDVRLQYPSTSTCASLTRKQKTVATLCFEAACIRKCWEGGHSMKTSVGDNASKNTACNLVDAFCALCDRSFLWTAVLDIPNLNLRLSSFPEVDPTQSELSMSCLNSASLEN